MQIGNVTAKPGQVTNGWIEIGETADGQPVQMPVQIVTGESPGPVLWVDGAIHGDELEGTAGIWRVFDRLTMGQLSGTLITVPITNVSAFHAARRTSPLDDIDINRVFPGGADRSYTWQLAERYLSTIEEHATHYINLHGGGNTHDVVYYLIYRSTGDRQAVDTSREMALVAGSTIVWKSQDAWLEQSSFAQLTEHGIPAIIVEAGGEGRIREHNVEAHASSIMNVMSYLGMLPSDTAVRAKAATTWISSADFFFSQRGGVWSTSRKVGDTLYKGDVVGVLQDRFGVIREEVACQVPEGKLLALRTYVAAPSGSNLGIVGVVET